VIISLLVVLLLVAATGALTHYSSRAVAAPRAYYGSDSSFLDQFSLSQYGPMVRLASQLDRKFLASAHGESLAACYRKIQRGLLRDYLRQASTDFNRLYSIANARCVQAASDPGDLSMMLLEQQMTFIMLIWGIEARLLLDGVLPFAIDLKPVVQCLENLAGQARELTLPRLSYKAV
jgi:hypothetical protein